MERRDIIEKISADNKELARNNATLTGKLAELTAQLKVSIKTIQEMATSSGKTKNASWTVELDYNQRGYCYTPG